MKPETKQDIAFVVICILCILAGCMMAGCSWPKNTKCINGYMYEQVNADVWVPVRWPMDAYCVPAASAVGK